MLDNWIIKIMKNIEKLKTMGNLYEALLNSKIELVRVWGYESMVSDTIAEFLDYGRHDEEEENLISIFNMIRDEVEKLRWNDNKIVAECRIGYWKVFIGYWDNTISVGLGVKPSDFLPKYESGVFGKPKYIKIR